MGPSAWRGSEEQGGTMMKIVKREGGCTQTETVNVRVGLCRACLAATGFESGLNLRCAHVQALTVDGLLASLLLVAVA